MTVFDGGDAYGSPYSPVAPVNTTETYWSIDGVSLQTYAFNIETIGGDRLSVPGLRGSNIAVPSAPGQRWLPKVADSRTITLGMWIIGANGDGSIPASSADQFDANYRMLRNLLWNPYKEFTVTKRFYVDGILKSAVGKAQFAGGLTPVMSGRTRATFTVDLFFSDPYFYSAPINTTLTTGDNTVDVEGDDRTRAISFLFDGPRKNPKVHNTELSLDFQYNGDIVSGDTVTVDIKNYTSITDPAATAPYKSVGSIRHAGDPSWFLLQPGTNTVTLSSDTGTGAVVMTHQAVWL